MRKASAALLTAFLLTGTSLSQGVTPESECTEAFRAADVIQDGVLTHTEIRKVQQIPSELAKAGIVGRQEFMAACVKTAQAKRPEEPAASKSPGASVSPETTGKKQPQGMTGPLETKEGGAPAESPQGQTPPGMQSAPDGSSKIIKDPNLKEP